MTHPCTPDLVKLALRSNAFDWGDDNADEQYCEPLFDYIRNYIINVKGVTRMKRGIYDNKGRTCINTLTVEDLMWPRWSMANS